MAAVSLHRDPGSFRDHSNAVFVGEDTVYRGLDGPAAAELRTIIDLPFFRAAVARGDLVTTDWLDSAPAGVDADWEAWLRHERVPTISYPYEWTFSMLREAALLQLRILAAALDADVVTKDATPYNVQFIGARPVFIDVGSFERYVPGEPWYGYRQFCQLFLFPLLLQAYKDIPFQPWLRGSVDGIDPIEARQLLRGWKRGWKGLATHVWLHARLEKRLQKSTGEMKESVRSGGFNKKLIQINVAKLTGLVEGLRWHAESSEWSGYGDREHYREPDLRAKEDLVRRVAAEVGDALVWDVGANDGHFSRIAAQHARQVLALDADRLVVDRLYRDLRSERNEKILPLAFDLADPSPPLGWRAGERLPLWQRSRPDLVLYLAVIHHLTITHHVPIAELLDFARTLSPRCVIEFPDRHDPMVQKLLRGKREGLHQDYRLDQFERLAAERFDVLQRVDLPGGTRTLFDLRSKG